MHVIRFLQGFDLRNPTRTLDLISPLSATARISLVQGGFAPGPGKLNIRWSGQNPRRDGQRRTGSTRDNGETTLKYILSGNSQTDVDVLQRKIFSFFRDAGLFEEDLQGEPVWAMTLWGEQGGLETLPAPVLGQFARYIRILKGETGSWPAETWHTVVAGYIEGVEMQLTYEPFFYGLPQRAGSATGDITITHDGVKVGNDTDPTWLRWPLTDELTEYFVIMGHVTVPAADADSTVFHYYVDADNQLLLERDATGDLWVATMTVGGDSITAQASRAFVANETIHFVIFYDLYLWLYTNGVLVDQSEDQSDPLPADGTLGLGSSASTSDPGTDLTFDGWRIFNTRNVIPADSVYATIYAAEWIAKDSTSEENPALIGPPAYWLTTAGDDVLTNATYGILAGVSGDVDALVKWDIRPADLGDNDETSVMWLSRYATNDATFTPNGTIFLSGDSHTFSGAGSFIVAPGISSKKPRGHVQFLGYISVDGADITVGPYLDFQDYDTVTVTDTGGDYLLYDLGEIFRNWPMFQASGLFDTAIGINVVGYNLVAAGASVFGAFFTLILPDPTCRIEAIFPPFTFTNETYKVIVGNDEAYGALDNDAISDKLRATFEKRGPGVTVEPGKYNSIVFLNGTEGVEFVDSDWIIVPFVTPRWLLPGGLVA